MTLDQQRQLQEVLSRIVEELDIDIKKRMELYELINNLTLTPSLVNEG